MSELKRTQLYDAHVEAGASLVDFGGWEMPVQYHAGIVAEHLWTRSHCSLFDVSHMGRLLVEGPERVKFLQYVLSNNVLALDVNQSQYCMIPDAEGGAVDDAYLCRFEEDKYLLVVNAANIEKDREHLDSIIKDYDCRITDISSSCAAIAVQGPETARLLKVLSGGKDITGPKKNALSTLDMEGHTVRASRTGYTGEPIGYELYIESESVMWLWNRLLELGAKPAGLGARDTLRLEAGLPLYGHDLGLDPSGAVIPIFALSLASFAVKFNEEKGDFIGRSRLLAQSEASKKIRAGDMSGCEVLPKKVYSVAMKSRGVMRAGMAVYRVPDPAGESQSQIGWITSGTMIPYYCFEGEGAKRVMTEKTAKRSIGLCYASSDLSVGDEIEIDVRGRHLRAVIVARHMDAGTPPYARPVLAD